jgi:hypothetical protein
LEDFKKWESSPVGSATSALTAQLELLRRLCETFPEGDSRGDEEILRLVVSGARPVGDQITMLLRNGTQGNVKIVRREISDRFGVTYTLETTDGSRFMREFFD